MPIDYRNYPTTWKAFSLAIRTERAHNQCECTGECGLHCTHPGPRRCVEHNGVPAVWAQGKIILTVAHLCTCTPLCVEAEHVKACCQRCHLRIDRFFHQCNAARTRLRRLEDLGQQHLWLPDFFAEHPVS
jgi:hypothetical protein